MGTIIKLRKTVETEAVQINSAEEDAVVRKWLAEMFVAGAGLSEDEATTVALAQDLTPVTDANGWFARDPGNPAVYLIDPETCARDYERVSSEHIRANNPFIIKE